MRENEKEWIVEENTETGEFRIRNIETGEIKYPDRPDYLQEETRRLQ